MGAITSQLSAKMKQKHSLPAISPRLETAQKASNSTQKKRKFSNPIAFTNPRKI